MLAFALGALTVGGAALIVGIVIGPCDLIFRRLEMSVSRVRVALDGSKFLIRITHIDNFLSYASRALRGRASPTTHHRSISRSDPLPPPGVFFTLYLSDKFRRGHEDRLAARHLVPAQPGSYVNNRRVSAGCLSRECAFWVLMCAWPVCACVLYSLLVCSIGASKLIERCLNAFLEVRR